MKLAGSAGGFSQLERVSISMTCAKPARSRTAARVCLCLPSVIRWSPAIEPHTVGSALARSVELPRRAVLELPGGAAASARRALERRNLLLEGNSLVYVTGSLAWTPLGGTRITQLVV